MNEDKKEEQIVDNLSSPTPEPPIVKVGFFEAERGIKSSTRLVLIVGAFVAYSLSVFSFFFGIWLLIADKVTLMSSLAVLVGVSVAPIFTFIGTLKLVQNSQER